MILRSPVATVWSSCPPAASEISVLSNPRVVVAGRIDRRRFAPDLVDEDRVDRLLANGVAAACLNSTQSREQRVDGGVPYRTDSSAVYCGH